MTLSEELKKKCIEILDKISSHPISEIFLNPIDPNLDGVPNYLEVISTPSDLSTVRKNLLENKFKDIYEFKKNVNLIWENAILFNGRPSLISIMADELSRKFTKYIKNIENIPREDWLTLYSKSQSILYKLFRSQPKHLEQFNLTPDTEMLVPERKNSRSWLTSEDTKLFKEVFQLIEDPTQISKLIQILTEQEPSIDPNEEEIQVNIQALSHKTLRALKFWALELKDHQI